MGGAQALGRPFTDAGGDVADTQRLMAACREGETTRAEDSESDDDSATPPLPDTPPPPPTSWAAGAGGLLSTSFEPSTTRRPFGAGLAVEPEPRPPIHAHGAPYADDDSEQAAATTSSTGAAALPRLADGGASVASGLGSTTSTYTVSHGGAPLAVAIAQQEPHPRARNTGRRGSIAALFSAAQSAISHVLPKKDSDNPPKPTEPASAATADINVMSAFELMLLPPAPGRPGISRQARQQGDDVFDDCFTGTEAVTFLMDSRVVVSRGSGVLLGRQMMRCGLLEHVQRKFDFEDQPFFFYRTVPQAPMRRMCGSLLALERELGSMSYEDTGANTSGAGTRAAAGDGMIERLLARSDSDPAAAAQALRRVFGAYM